MPFSSSTTISIPIAGSRTWLVVTAVVGVVVGRLVGADVSGMVRFSDGRVVALCVGLMVEFKVGSDVGANEGL
jgi:hypothetical protein